MTQLLVDKNILDIYRMAATYRTTCPGANDCSNHKGVLIHVDSSWEHHRITTKAQ